jgi:dCTP deaminase
MAVNGKTLLELAPIKNMLTTKEKLHGVSYGLGEAGYDIRVKQDVTFTPHMSRFRLASAIEEFDMPDCLVGIVHDKSTWARKGLSVFNTVVEPGWKGWLTLELVYHGNDVLIIPAGSGIAQVIFHRLSDVAHYEGKYQNQENKPVAARKS